MDVPGIITRTVEDATIVLSEFWCTCLSVYIYICVCVCVYVMHNVPLCVCVYVCVYVCVCVRA